MAPVHTGPARREYADFAFRLVQEIFDNRKNAAPLKQQQKAQPFTLVKGRAFLSV